MPEIEVNIEVYCTRCGNGLCDQTVATKTWTRGELCFKVEPCEECLSKAYDEGYVEGYKQAKEEE